MRGETTEADLKTGQAEEVVVASEIGAYTGVSLAKCDERFGDFRSASGRFYEVKSDPRIGQSPNFMIELFASIHPVRFEKGWAYRYDRLDWLCYYNPNEIYMYRWQGLKRFFWDNVWRLNKTEGWRLHSGVARNREGWVALIPFSEVEQFLEKIINRRMAA